ncbi:hypothetical protein CKO20_01135 [Rhodocyclus tenuis]|nr:hypothetical protein [Rhodocyclus tenuis]
MNDASGNDSPLATHFGLAGRFAVIDSENGEILADCPVGGVCRGPCGCPLPDLSGSKLDAIAGRSVGFRLLQLSRRAGLPVLASAARTLGELRRELAADRLRPLSAATCVSNARAASGRGR